ncbi:hypothetical protein EAF00_005034 [Botryotinia globosa]|nr:hypothetical protein EAF00_005034 [Botryotinia globosa]
MDVQYPGILNRKTQTLCGDRLAASAPIRRKEKGTAHWLDALELDCVEYCIRISRVIRASRVPARVPLTLKSGPVDIMMINVHAEIMAAQLWNSTLNVSLIRDNKVDESISHPGKRRGRHEEVEVSGQEFKTYLTDIGKPWSIRNINLLNDED